MQKCESFLLNASDAPEIAAAASEEVASGLMGLLSTYVPPGLGRVCCCCWCRRRPAASWACTPSATLFSPLSVFHVFSPLPVARSLPVPHRNRIVTMMTTVTRIRAVATPPRMLMRGWRLSEAASIEDELVCSGSVDSGFSSPCSDRVLSAICKQINVVGGRFVYLFYSIHFATSLD